MSTVAPFNQESLPRPYWPRGLEVLVATLAVLLTLVLRLPYQFPLLIIVIGSFALAVLRVDVFLYAVIFFLPIPLRLPEEFPLHDATMIVRVMMFLGVLVRFLLEGRSLRSWLLGTRLSQLAIGYGFISVLSALLFNERSAVGMAAPVWLLSYLCLYFTVIGWVRSQQQMRTVIAVLLLSTVIVALFGIYQALIGGYSDLYFWLHASQKEYLLFWTGRITSFLDHFNTLAGYLHLVLPFALASTLICVTRGLRFLAISCLATATIALILTQSRGGAFAFGGTILLALFLLARNTKNIRALAPTVFLTLIIALPFVAAFSTRFATLEDESGLMRFGFWGAAWGMFQSSPFVGVGYGNFVKLYGDSLQSLEAGHYDAHNLYLQLLAETGVLGFMVFMALVALALLAAWRQFHCFQSPTDRIVGFAALAAISSVLVHGFTDTLLDLPQCGALFWMILALLVANDQLSGDSRLAAKPGLA